MDSWIGWIVTLHTLSTVMMVGIIWFVQVVHYPLFALINRDQLGDYEHNNIHRTAIVVAPTMLVEISTAIGLFYLPPGTVGLPIRIAGATLVAILWLSTLTLQWPIHHRLQQGFSPTLFRRLLRTNWIRTVGWSARALVALEIAHQAGYF